jgi:hypothetical protein
VDSSGQLIAVRAAKGWLDPVIVAAFGLAAVLLASFVLRELRTREPQLLPESALHGRLLRDRYRLLLALRVAVEEAVWLSGGGGIRTSSNPEAEAIFETAKNVVICRGSAPVRHSVRRRAS